MNFYLEELIIWSWIADWGFLIRREFLFTKLLEPLNFKTENDLFLVFFVLDAFLSFDNEKFSS